MDADRIMMSFFNFPYALLVTYGLNYDTSPIELVLYEMVTGEEKLEEKFCDRKIGSFGYAAMISNNYIIYYLKRSFLKRSFSVMDFLGNRILTVELDPLNALSYSFEHHFIQSGKLVFFELNSGEKLTKLHVFDMKSVNEVYEKKGEVMCSSSGHDSQTSFKSRSISIKDRNFRYTYDDDDVKIRSDKASVSLYVYDDTEMVARKSKFSFWNGKENPIFGRMTYHGDKDDDPIIVDGDNDVDEESDE